RWMASNVVVRVDPSDNIRFDKAKSAEKVDGIVAAAMAVGRALQAQKTAQSVYEERGVLTV
ncbi:MAG TPA: terminase large subunit, partial [Phycisphaerae bacterium]|nr:terminase large subunit [Phycisphaerae bacterium]